MKRIIHQKDRECVHNRLICLTAGMKLGNSYCLPVTSGTVTAMTLTRGNNLQTVCWWEENNES